MFYKTNPPKNGNSDSKYDFIVMKRGLKAARRARRAPEHSAGARRRGAECPKLLVVKNKTQIKLKNNKHIKTCT